MGFDITPLLFQGLRQRWTLSNCRSRETTSTPWEQTADWTPSLIESHTTFASHPSSVVLGLLFPSFRVPFATDGEVNHQAVCMLSTYISRQEIEGRWMVWRSGWYQKQICGWWIDACKVCKVSIAGSLLYSPLDRSYLHYDPCSGLAITYWLYLCSSTCAIVARFYFSCSLFLVSTVWITLAQHLELTRRLWSQSPSTCTLLSSFVFLVVINAGLPKSASTICCWCRLALLLDAIWVFLERGTILLPACYSHVTSFPRSRKYKLSRCCVHVSWTLAFPTFDSIRGFMSLGVIVQARTEINNFTAQITNSTTNSWSTDSPLVFHQDLLVDSYWNGANCLHSLWKL